MSINIGIIAYQIKYLCDFYFYSAFSRIFA